MKSERAWNFKGSTPNESTLKALCQGVEKHIHLPSGKLCRYFATFEDSGLCDEIGKHYRGFYCPRSQTEGLPQYLMECFFRIDDQVTGVNFGDLIAFDDLILHKVDHMFRREGMRFNLRSRVATLRPARVLAALATS
jgi:hypothetical protein